MDSPTETDLDAKATQAPEAPQKAAEAGEIPPPYEDGLTAGPPTGGGGMSATGGGWGSGSEA